MKKRKVLLIGWDGADWKYLTPLIDAGLMPNLKKLIEGGSMGRLATLDPPLSPTLWTSIATGKRPYKHGIHGFTEPDPSGDGIRPIYITNRKCKAIWNILTQHKLKTHVVGWWPSHPAEPINGTMVSNLYQRAGVGINEVWPLLKGTIHPSEQTDLFAKLRIHPDEITVNHILPFIPNLHKVNQTEDRRPKSVAKILADCSTIHSAATYIMENEAWDFMGIYYDAIDHFCHGFMKYHPPHRKHIPLKDFELYHDVVNSGCRYHDMMLGRLMELAGEDTNIILVSDHGFHPDHNRPKGIPKEPAGPAIEHSPYGIIVMNGPDVRVDGSIFGASLLDITPTILSMYGLPVAEDMDGKILTNAFDKLDIMDPIKSWENILGDDGRHPENMEINKDDARAELQQLIELGYIEDPGKNGAAAVKSTIDENNYNLARAYIDGNKWKEGIEILEELHEQNPKVFRFAVRLVHGYQATGRYKDSRKMVDHLRSILDRESPQLDMIEGSQLIAEERHKKALQLFKKVEREASEQPNINLRIANAYFRLNQLEDAENAIYKELNLNPEEVKAHYTLGLIYFHQMRYEEAVNAFMDAIGLMYYYPAAHYYVGECYAEMEDFDKALEAYKTCLTLVPGMNLARKRIINIYENKLYLPGKAIKYKRASEGAIKGTINIVSGLPRSGTSLMMQMLEAGGLEIFTDKKRAADESNPQGYYEHEAVKALKRNKSFLKDANGKTLKVIAQLLEELPLNYAYRIVFMKRNLKEVLSSQQKMLHRQGKNTNSEAQHNLLLKQYEDTIKKVSQIGENLPNIQIIYVNYGDIMERPFEMAMLINDFFEGGLKVERMAAVVNPQLYREKLSELQTKED